MEFRVEVCPERILLGCRKTMSLRDHQVAALWSEFRASASGISHRIGNHWINLKEYGRDYFTSFNPAKIFDQWAVVEVSKIDRVPEGMEVFYLASGLYAVFEYRGTAAGAASFFQKIFTSVLPQSEFSLDHRPFFEVLPSDYRPDDPAAQEEVWIPIRAR